jgi:hypothetical protein
VEKEGAHLTPLLWTSLLPLPEAREASKEYKRRGMDLVLLLLLLR